jgi:flagellar hook-length control protein FliK
VGDADDDITKTTTSADSTQSGGSSSQQNSSSNQDGGGSGATSAAALLNPQVSIGPNLAAQQVPTHHSDLKSPVGTSAWTDELSGKVTWMAQQGIESASLKLSPEHLGPVEVHISVQNGSTSVMFGAAQPDTRAALEQALPRLHEMFAGQGLTLADAGVSREPPRQQARPSAVAPVSGISAVSAETASVSAVMPVRLGLLDTYA